jgi:poly(3-hydroxybutyrate) depolymerase
MGALVRTLVFLCAIVCAAPHTRAQDFLLPGRYELKLDNVRDGAVYVPKGYKAGVSTPLLVWLHGAGGQGNVSMNLAAMADERLELLMWEGQRPDSLRGGFLGAYVREGPIRRRNAVEAFVFQHGSRHLGELEHARALVGLGGLS